jgi:predicted ABC-type ATPase
MYIVAGPPGSGKSRVFPVKDHGVAFFNADDRAAELNGGSYQAISLVIRSQVSRELEAFIEGHIDRCESFAFETTLRTSITFEQARRARSKGIIIKMLYVAIADVAINLERIANRVTLGFHSAPIEVLLDIHARSLHNLSVAIRECGKSIDELAIYDNTTFDQPPRLLAEFEQGRLLYLSDDLPQWLKDALLDEPRS